VNREETKEKLKSAWAFVSSPPATRMGVGLAGRATAIILGWICMMLGVILTLTLCGAVIGVPLFAFGFLLVARGFF
jgi:hypothetical protein